VVNLLTAGTLSSGLEGKQLSEMFDMKQSGAVAFTDDKENVGTELMVRALDYSRNFDGMIISFPMDKGVNPGGMLHEGPTSVSMGLKGLSSASEEIRLTRDIELLRYCGGRLHVSLISTAGSVELIKKAKKDGLNITASIASHQLAFTDADMSSFDSNLKVLPPFRGESDKKALIKGLKDGVIDAICSDHSPEDHEHKVLEFEYANYGISSIQTSFAVAYEALKNTLSLEEILSKFTTGPAHVLKSELPIIKEGNSAALTIFATETEQTFGKKEWKSKSINSPFFNTKFSVRVVDVI
jgi:dihydroorotase